MAGSVFGKKWMPEICSLLFAFFMWLAVASNVSTDTTKDFKVKVSAKSLQEALGGATLKPVADEYVASVRVSGSRRVLGTLNAEKDLEVYADVSKVISPGEYNLGLYCNVLNGRDIDVVTVYPKAINVRFDKLITRKFTLDLNLDGVTLPSDYVRAQPSLTSTEVTVTGPEAELAQIETCKLCFGEKTELKKTTTLNGKVKFYKSDGSELESENLNCSNSNIDVTIPVFRAKEVLLDFDFINQPSNLDVDRLKFRLSKETLKIGCDPEQYDDFTELFLGYIDVSKLTPENKTVVLDLDTLTEEKNLLNLDEETELTIEFDMRKFAEKTISTSNIKLVNQGTKGHAKVLTSRVSDIKLVGGKESIAKIQGSNVAVTIDLREIGTQKGRFAAPVTITIPGVDDVWAVGDYEVYLSVD